MSCIESASCCAGAARSLARLDFSDGTVGVAGPRSGRSGTVGKSGVGRGMAGPFPGPAPFPTPPAFAPPPREAPPPFPPPCAAPTCVGNSARDETNASRLTAFWVFIVFLCLLTVAHEHTVLSLRVRPSEMPAVSLQRQPLAGAQRPLTVCYAP